MPINLHLEQFTVEKGQQEESDCYDFTSVGAFTTAHTNKMTYQKPIELLMYYDKPFSFSPDSNNNNQTQVDSNNRTPIENEILLNFYTLKIFIEIGNNIKLLRIQNLNSTNVTSFNRIFTTL